MQTFQKIKALFRVNEWYDSKIPLMLAIYLYCYLRSGTTAPIANGFAATFLFFTTYLALNYLINDYFDLEIDKRAGKVKVVQQFHKHTVWWMMVSLVILGSGAVFLLMGFRWSTLLMVLLIYAMGASYSVKYVRLKERGLLGVIVSSFAQRNSCLLLMLTWFPIAADVFALWMVVSFVNGLRYILIHQYIDYENDKKAGIRLFIDGKVTKCKAAINASMILEVLCLLLLFREALLHSMAAVVFAAVCAAIFGLNYYFVEKVLHQSYFYSFANTPLEDFYNVFLPLAMGSVLLQAGSYGIFLFMVLYLAYPLCKKLYMPYMAVRKLIEGSR